MHVHLGERMPRSCLVCNDAALVFRIKPKTSHMSSVRICYAPTLRTGLFLAPRIGVVSDVPVNHLQSVCGFLYDSYALFGVNSEEIFRVCLFCSGKQFTDKRKKRSALFLDITRRQVVILEKSFEQHLQC
jgi:hypothetical protein